jgi:hypothetical protein
MPTSGRSRAAVVFDVVATFGDWLRDFLMASTLLFTAASLAQNWYDVHGVTEHFVRLPLIFEVLPSGQPGGIPICPEVDAMGVCEARRA